MTQSQATEYWPLLKAFSEGKTIQWQSMTTGSWRDCEGSKAFAFRFDDGHKYRIKPEPRLRPWKPEEVPMPCVIRSKDSHSTRWLILSVSSIGISTADSMYDKVTRVSSFESLLEFNEYSLNMGRDWLPCGIYEE